MLSSLIGRPNGLPPTQLNQEVQKYGIRKKYKSFESR